MLANYKREKAQNKVNKNKSTKKKSIHSCWLDGLLFFFFPHDTWVSLWIPVLISSRIWLLTSRWIQTPNKTLSLSCRGSRASRGWSLTRISRGTRPRSQTHKHTMKKVKQMYPACIMRDENNYFLSSLTETVFILWGLDSSSDPPEWGSAGLLQRCRTDCCVSPQHSINNIGVVISLIFRPDSTYTIIIFCLRPVTCECFVTIIVNGLSPLLWLIAPCRWEEEEYVPVLSTWHGWTSCPVTSGHLSCWSEETRKMSSPSIASDAYSRLDTLWIRNDHSNYILTLILNLSKVWWLSIMIWLSDWCVFCTLHAHL